jgi:hypothetical protein
MLSTNSMPRSENATLEQAERRSDGIGMNIALDTLQPVQEKSAILQASRFRRHIRAILHRHDRR